MNLVSRSRGARPPGRAPRCTMSVGIPVARSARRVAPSPSRRHRGESPSTTAPLDPAAVTTPPGPASASTGSTSTPTTRWMAMDADARSLLASPEPSPPPAPGADQPQRATGSGGEPGPQLGCGPVVVATAEEHGDPALEGRRRRPGEQRHVARRALEHEGDRVGHRAVPPQVLWGIDHRQVGLVRQRQPRRVGSGGTGDEGGGPARDARSPEVVAAGARGRHGVGEQLLARNDPGHEQLMAAERGESGADGDQAVQRSAVPRGQEHGPDGVLRRGDGRATGRIEAGILLEDPPLELLQRGRRLEAEGLHERGASLAEPRQRIRLPPGAIEGDHQVPSQAFVKGVVEHELLDLAHELRAAAQLELGSEAPLRDREAQVGQALDHRPGEGLEREVGERRPAPLRERLPVARDGRPGVARGQRRPGVVREALDREEVERVRCHADPVAGRAGLDDRPGRAGRAPRLQEQPQLGDLAVHLRDRADRGRPAVQLLGEAVDRHDPVRIQEQDRQDRSLPGAAETDRPLGRAHLERAQDAEDEFQATTVRREGADRRPVAAR